MLRFYSLLIASVGATLVGLFITNVASARVTKVVIDRVESPTLGTHPGWAVRADVPGEMCGNLGQFIPFAKTKVDREAVGDPRPSLAERYPTKQDYVARVTQAVQTLQTQRLLSAEDAAAYIADAEHKASNLIPSQ